MTTDTPVLQSLSCADTVTHTDIQALKALLEKHEIRLVADCNNDTGYFGEIILPSKSLDKNTLIDDLLNHENPVLACIGQSLALYTHAPVGYEPNPVEDALPMALHEVLAKNSANLHKQGSKVWFYESIDGVTTDCFSHPISDFVSPDKLLDDERLDDIADELMIEFSDYGYNVLQDDELFDKDTMVEFYIHSGDTHFTQQQTLFDMGIDWLASNEIIYDKIDMQMRDWRSEHLSMTALTGGNFVAYKK